MAAGNKVLLITTVPVKYSEGKNQPQNLDGVNIISVIITQKGELPIRGAVDFEIYNLGATTAYLFGTDIAISPGTQWSLPKSTMLPIANQPLLTFSGDYQNTRIATDIVPGNPSAH